ncbi:hypothetical protein TC41_2452 [Alicyclobacillus acidocaldarius subsp. acidocaldarius Tc-4-1]|uniref:Uncharacterized protein n=1 Tax=Alicyclobacillus acidocaldarius (strain Tc-4-1) TaxID=1048834 RepID=F8IGZ7_ALIAT|nr:hypothetical protein TC41_2452 [Alicyclobacillus acidocaldarius subsp. acidocaldarius Tc-4-1]
MLCPERSWMKTFSRLYNGSLLCQFASEIASDCGYLEQA